MAALDAKPDPEADGRVFFERRVTALMDRMFSVAMRYCRDQADAEDLVAETLVKSWKAFDSLDDRERFDGWIMRILSNTYISQWRRKKTSQGIFDDEAECHDLDDADSLYARLHQPFLLWYGAPERQFVKKLLSEDISHALHALSDGYRSVVIMVEILGFSYEEAAASLEVPIGTIRSRLNRARRQLQNALWQHAQTAGESPATAPGKR